MLRSEKKEFVAELEAIYQSSGSIIITHYHGLTVAQITALRKKLRENGAGFRVVKNTLSKIAANNTGFENITNLFSGPVAVAFSKDLIAAAKIIEEFAKNNNQLKVIGGIVDNQVLDEKGVKKLAKLPSMNELRGKMIGVLQASATKLVYTLQAPGTQLARLFQAYVNNKN